jgi:DNA-binding NarL/FixJ family response regulator
VGPGIVSGRGPERIRVVLADDQTLVRAGLRILLDVADDIEVVGEADDGHEALAAARRHRPHVVLMDIRMPGRNGIEATRDLVADARLRTTKVLVLTTFELDEYVFDALAAGANGFLLKDAEPDELRHAVRVVAAGDALLAPSVTRRVVERFAGRRPGPDPHHAALVATLTAREREVVAQVARGLTNDEIAEVLVMSPATAKTHVSRAMTKLRCRDRAQVVVSAYEAGVVEPGTLGQ